ncbi:MAG: hypothetical protein H6608_12360 [Flavobacteriales bacterium]|nr:hypothetical protein [Bacteroidota bacterium]MCB9241924.1 hypothetical protein [Flavobacteriales bacterium]
MNTYIKSVLFLTLSFSLFSFKLTDNRSVTGTYGVSASDPSGIELIIHDDHTFQYRDRSDANNPISASGTWSEKGNKIVLNDATQTNFHRIWTIEEDGSAARSRKGLSFYRLCRIN